MTASISEQIQGFLERSKKILILTPSRATIDDQCGGLALRQILEKQGKEVLLVSESEISPQLSFLSETKNFQKNLGSTGDFVISVSNKNSSVERVKYNMTEDGIDILLTPQNGNFDPSDVSFRQGSQQFDVLFVLGADSLSEVGKIFENTPDLFTRIPIVNISASPSAESFGRVNLIDPSQTSVCEILSSFFRNQKDFSFSKDIATMLLTGIIERTGSFLKPTTSASGLEAASILQQTGADQSQIIEHIFKKKSLSTLKVWGRVLSNLELDTVHRLAWSAVTKADFELVDSEASDTGPMIDELLRYTKGAELTALFLEKKDETFVQIRASHTPLDFSALQKYLGGAGEIVSEGLDIHLEKKSVAEVEYQILQLLVDFQKSRLHIAPDIGIQKTELSPENKSPAQTSFPILQHRSQPEVSPTPPAEIPFEAPGQTSQPGYTSDVPTGTQSAEVTLKPDDSRIPDWLRKKE
ncbi:hypothetical protein K9M59_04310 [Candidatus Gracilibacteria bacterium]|nr:hypothetical protein [Candidatus Gracilibacteria bacterium]MCF7819543.1 hypothetical protein [Candidatus Gracilibacteria bacterium]